MNVGGHRVTMDRLREICRNLGLIDVRTFIASGNVIFDSAEEDLASLEARIEVGLRESLGYRVDTFIRTGDEVRALAGSDPFPGADLGTEDRIHVIFLRKPPSPEVEARLKEVVPAGDAFAFRDPDLVWLRRGTFMATGLRSSDPVQEVSAVTSTMRTMNTLRRMAAAFLT